MSSARPLVDVRVRGSGLAGPVLTVTPSRIRNSRWRLPTLGGGSGRSRTAAATRHIATLLQAGFTLDRALSTAASLYTGRRVGSVMLDVQDRVRAGSSLASALAEHPAMFGQFYRGLVAAGERSGRLAEAFGRLADHLDQQAELRSRLLSALLYPTIMVATGSAAVLLLLVYVIPRFAGIMGELGGELPWSAEAVLALSRLVGAGWWLAALAAVAGLGAVLVHRRTPAGRVAQDLWLLRLPVVGSVRGRLAAERSARALAGALSGGIPLVEALDIAADAAGDAAFRDHLSACSRSVQRGERLAAPLRRGGVFPELAVQMISAGEESGRLVPMLEHVASVYRRETERYLQTLVSLVEPLIIVVFGAAVGFVAVALLQTIYGIGTAF